MKLRVAHAPTMPATLFRHWLQRKLLVSDSGMHHGTCVTHMPWCMSGSLTRGGGENVSGIPGACATRKFTHLVRGPLVEPTLKCRSVNSTQTHINTYKHAHVWIWFLLSIWIYLITHHHALFQVYFKKNHTFTGGKMSQYLHNLSLGDFVDFQGPCGQMHYNGCGE